MATAGILTVNSTNPVEIYADVTGCTVFMVKVNPSSSVAVLVNATNVHQPDEWFKIWPGQAIGFHNEVNAITSVNVKMEAAQTTTDIEYGVIGKHTE